MGNEEEDRLWPSHACVEIERRKTRLMGTKELWEFVSTLFFFLVAPLFPPFPDFFRVSPCQNVGKRGRRLASGCHQGPRTQAEVFFSQLNFFLNAHVLLAERSLLDTTCCILRIGKHAKSCRNIFKQKHCLINPFKADGQKGTKLCAHKREWRNDKLWCVFELFFLSLLDSNTYTERRSTTHLPSPQHKQHPFVFANTCLHWWICTQTSSRVDTLVQRRSQKSEPIYGHILKRERKKKVLVIDKARDKE